ncbi:hypothetical protein HJG53_13800 [Sphingomonas sp. ID1715]|uniref:hypothetical protein n=1 Tax=Sphingomonas sp. ID1715 TaxID=1656898 RepID=UPI0014883FA4|nr:hypothetical protein [Sphingomonas sp. ID1715]NNM77977.1 hypothetical protein [Sphingomonas sp. ID1715]
MTRLILFLILWLGCCLYALIRGGGPEKIGGIIFLAAALLSLAVEQPEGSRWNSVELGMLLVDLAVFVSLLTLAVAANRFWPLWMSGMQGVQVFSHFAIALDAKVIPWAYWNAQTLWSYPMLALLAAATSWHRSRLRRQGADPSWRRFFGSSTQR